MSQSRAQRALALKVKLGILAVLKDQRLDSTTIIRRVVKAIPATNRKQVESILRSMGDYIVVDHTEPRHFYFSLAPLEHPQELEPEDDGVIQRVVPASTFPCIPVFIQRNPMQWCVDMLAGA